MKNSIIFSHFLTKIWLSLFVLASYSTAVFSISFAPPVSPSASIATQYQVDTDAQGNMAAVWLQSTGVFVSVLPISTGVWTTPVQLSTATTNAKIATADNGYTVVMWIDGNFLYSSINNISTSPLGSWTAQTQIPYNLSAPIIPPNTIEGFAMAINKSNGNVTANWWVDFEGTSFPPNVDKTAMLSYYPTGGSWSTQNVFNWEYPNPIGSLSLGMDNRNTFIANYPIVNTATNNYFINQLVNNFGTVIDSSQIRQERYNGNLNVGLSFSQAITGFDNHFSIGFDGTNQALFRFSNTFLQNATTLVPSNVTSAFGAATLLRNYIFYTTANSVSFYVNDGAVTSAPITLYTSTATTPSVGQVFASGSEGGILVVWIDSNNLYYSYLSPYATSFSIPALVPTATNVSSPQVSLKDLGQGTASISWLNTAGELQTSIVTNVFGNPPAPPPVPSNPGFQTVKVISTALGGNTIVSDAVDEDALGNGVVVWAENVVGTNYKIIKASDALANQAWSSETILANINDGLINPNPKVLVDNNGNATVFWYDGNGIFSKEKPFGQPWSFDQFIVTAPQLKNYEVAIDKYNGNIALIYATNFSNGEVGIGSHSFGSFWDVIPYPGYVQSFDFSISSVGIDIGDQNNITASLTYESTIVPLRYASFVETTFDFGRIISQRSGTTGTTTYPLSIPFSLSPSYLALDDTNFLWALEPTNGGSVIQNPLPANLISSVQGVTVGSNW